MTFGDRFFAGLLHHLLNSPARTPSTELHAVRGWRSAVTGFDQDRGGLWNVFRTRICRRTARLTNELPFLQFHQLVHLLAAVEKCFHLRELTDQARQSIALDYDARMLPFRQLHDCKINRSTQKLC